MAPCIVWGPGSPQGKVQFWGLISAHSEVWGISQSYSLGGSRDAAFCFQYCRNLLLFRHVNFMRLLHILLIAPFFAYFSKLNISHIFSA